MHNTYIIFAEIIEIMINLLWLHKKNLVT